MNIVFPDIIEIIKGGPGSGNFGHEGRPGEVGGSGEGGSDNAKNNYVLFDKLDVNDEWLSKVRHENEKLSAEDENCRKLMRTLDFKGNTGIAIRKDSEPDLNILNNRGLFQNPINSKVMLGIPNECHSNSARYYEKGKIEKIITGYALSSDGLWRQHSWGMKSGKIVETTAARIGYYGVALNAKESNAFCKNN